MTILRRTHLTGGTLLTAFLVASAPYAAAKKPVLTTLHKFKGGKHDGEYPYANIVVGSDGVLYGTTLYGGTYDAGTVYSLTPPAAPGGAWTETVLYSFDDGGLYGAVAIGSGGVLYGTTWGGGNNGTVFSLTPPASPGGAWTESVLYQFTFGGSAGAGPYAGVVIDTNGVLYGATYDGGLFPQNICNSGCGAVFSLSPPASPGGAWTETTLHTFTGDSTGYADGATPAGGLVLCAGGVLYGTTSKWRRLQRVLRSRRLSRGPVWHCVFLDSAGLSGWSVDRDLALQFSGSERQRR
jgi:uncharacterized repeat protein (TIGR03803 family)